MIDLYSHDATAKTVHKLWLLSISVPDVNHYAPRHGHGHRWAGLIYELRGIGSAWFGL